MASSSGTSIRPPPSTPRFSPGARRDGPGHQRYAAAQRPHDLPPRHWSGTVMTIRHRLASLGAILVFLGSSFAVSGQADALFASSLLPPAAAPRPALAPLSGGLAEVAADRSLGERALDDVHYLADDIGSRPAGSEAER